MLLLFPDFAFGCNYSKGGSVKIVVITKKVYHNLFDGVN